MRALHRVESESVTVRRIQVEDAKQRVERESVGRVATSCGAVAPVCSLALPAPLGESDHTKGEEMLYLYERVCCEG